MSQHTLPRRPGGEPSSTSSFRRQGSLGSKSRDSSGGHSPAVSSKISPSPPSQPLPLNLGSVTSFSRKTPRYSPRSGTLSPHQRTRSDLQLSPKNSPITSPRRQTSRKALLGRTSSSTHARTSSTSNSTTVPHLPPLLGEVVHSDSDSSCSSNDDLEQRKGNPLSLEPTHQQGPRKKRSGVKARKLAGGISSDSNNSGDDLTTHSKQKRSSKGKMTRSDSLDAKIARQLREDPVIQEANEVRRKLVEEHKKSQSKDKKGNWIDWVARNKAAMGGAPSSEATTTTTSTGIHGRVGRTNSHKVRRTSSLKNKGATLEEILGPPLFDLKARKQAQSPDPVGAVSSKSVKGGRQGPDGIPPTHGGRLRWLPSVTTSTGEGTPVSSGLNTPTSGSTPRNTAFRPDSPPRASSKHPHDHVALVQANRMRQQDRELADREEAVRKRAQEKDPETIRLKRWTEMIVHAIAFPVMFRRCLAAQERSRREAHAKDILERLFLPLWRFYKHKLRASAESAICKALYRRAVSKRIRNRGSAADTIQKFLRTKHLYFSYVVRWYVLHVKKAQRIAKRHLRMRAAQIELNYRRCRKYEKEEYWLEAKHRREALEQGALDRIKNDVKEELMFVDDWDKGFTRWREIEELEHRRRERANRKSLVDSISLNPSVGDDDEVGTVRRIPEMFLRRRIRTLVNAKARERILELSNLRREHEYEMMLKSQSHRLSPRGSPRPAGAEQPILSGRSFHHAPVANFSSSSSHQHRQSIVGAIRRSGSFARSGSFKGSLPASMRGGPDSKLLPQQPWNLIFDTSECVSVLDQAARTTESMRDDVTWSIHTFKVEHLVIPKKR